MERNTPRELIGEREKEYWIWLGGANGEIMIVITGQANQTGVCGQPHHAATPCRWRRYVARGAIAGSTAGFESQCKLGRRQIHDRDARIRFLRLAGGSRRAGGWALPSFV